MTDFFQTTKHHPVEVQMQVEENSVSCIYYVSHWQVAMLLQN